MSQMVDRIARIIGDDQDIARAVIRAMREPTPPMMLAAWEADHSSIGTAIDIYQAMIDEAIR